MPIINKPNNALQKGERRQKLHNNQNNVGNKEIPPKYTGFDGNPIKQ